MAQVHTTAPDQPKERSLIAKAIILTVVVVPFVATIYAMVMLWQRAVGWTEVGLMLGLYILSGLGITIGYHRLLTHKSFSTYPPIKALLLIMGSLALEGGPIYWASTHIQHHAHSDEEDDPHSPLENFWYAHLGWLFKHEADPDKYGTWLRRDPVIVWVNRTWMFWSAMGLLIPFLIAGWPGLIWGGLVRIFLTHHITWSVNSICHTFGQRPFQTTDASRNNWLVGLLAFGEGWHNNHHAFPRAAYHGLRWWQIDISAYIIRGMQAVGLAWDVHQVRPEDEERLNRRAAQTAAATD